MDENLIVFLLEVAVVAVGLVVIYGAIRFWTGWKNKGD